MSNVSNVPNRGISPDYSSDLPPAASSAKKEAQEATAKASSATVDIDELIKNDPHLKALFDKLVKAFSEEPDEVKFSISQVVQSLIQLSQALSNAAVAYADRLSKITEKMNAYTKLQTQIPVVLKGGKDEVYGGDDDKSRAARSEANQKFANMLEAVRANKGLEEDKAKKVQTMLQGLKDGGTSSSDFVGSFIDLVRGIGSKIAQ